MFAGSAWQSNGTVFASRSCIWSYVSRLANVAFVADQRASSRPANRMNVLGHRASKITSRWIVAVLKRIISRFWSKIDCVVHCVVVIVGDIGGNRCHYMEQNRTQIRMASCWSPCVDVFVFVSACASACRTNHSTDGTMARKQPLTRLASNFALTWHLLKKWKHLHSKTIKLVAGLHSHCSAQWTIDFLIPFSCHKISMSVNGQNNRPTRSCCRWRQPSNHLNKTAVFGQFNNMPESGRARDKPPSLHCNGHFLYAACWLLISRPFCH